MKRTTYKLLLYTAAILCSVLLFTSKSHAQHQVTAAILDPIWEHPDTLLPIDVSNITSSAEATSIILSDINSKLPDSATMASFVARLNQTLHDIDSVYQEFSGVTEDDINSKLLNKTRNTVASLSSDKESLKADLQASVSDLQNFHLRVEYLSGSWEATIQYGQANNMSPSLIDRSRQVFNEVLLFGEKLENKADTVIFYSDQLLGGSKLLEEIKTKAEEYESLFEMRYLGKTHAALWEKDTIIRKDSAGFFSALSEVKGTYREGISDFYSAYKIRLFINLGIFILMLITTLLVNRNLKRRHIKTDDARINLFLAIFRRPVAIAVMLALFVFLALYPNVSVVIRDITSFIILVPLIIVSRLVLQKRWHPILYLLSGLFLFGEIIETLRFESFPLPRFLLLGIMLFSLVYLILEILKRKRENRSDPKPKIRFIDLALWSSLTIIFAALVADSMGYVPLSFFLFRATIISAIAGLLISVTVTVVDGLFTLLIMGGSSSMYDKIREYGIKLVDRIVRVVRFFALIYWISIVLKRFLIYDDVLAWLTGILETKWEFNEMIISVEGILLFVLIIFLAVWLSKLIRLILEKEVFPRFKFSRGLPGIISLMVRVTIIVLGMLLSFAALGISMDKLTILIGALGVGIGFGLQDIINNLISGFILVFERPIQSGDTVQFGDKEGIVKEIGIRASTIKTYDGTEVIVPNGKLISNELVNLTLSDPMLRIEIDIGTDYDSDPQEVLDILVMQAKLHPDVTKNPEAFAIFFGYGDFALKFRLYAYTYEVSRRLRIRSELNLAIGAAFKDAGIKIPFPIQDINVKMEEAKPKAKK